VTANQAYLLTGPGSLVLQSQALPDLPADWARVRFLYCGLCGSDLSKFEGRRSLDYPVSLGHEFLAEVVEVGDEVERLAPGALVTSDLNFRCGACDQCLAGRSHLCHRGQIGLFNNRAFAELGNFHESYLLPVEGESGMHISLAEPLSCVLHGDMWAEPGPDDRILVIGAGGLGSCMAFALCNRSPSVTFEIFDQSPSRLALIADAIDPIGTAISRPTGEYDCVFDLSGSESGLRIACEYVRSGGRLCSLSHLDGYSTGEFLLPALTRRDVTFKVSYLNGEPSTLRRAVALLASNWDSSWNQIVEVVPLGLLQQAFEDRRHSPWCKTVLDIGAHRSLA
jgi:threonine dehydrogenase-like Zn-dependent dehydrogenase